MNNYTCSKGTIPYVLKAGDTLYKLANDFDTTVNEILKHNPHINPNYLRIGEKICIPHQQNYPACPDGNYHIVRPGDTLYKISQMYNISLEAIIKANQIINPNMLRIGQLICVPLGPIEECPSGTKPYTIKKGDTFYSIAKKYNIPLSMLIRVNPKINIENLIPGEKICIPKYWSTYHSKVYKASFIYPIEWEKLKDDHYEGDSGYFTLSAISTDEPLEQVCKEEAFQDLKPYGTNPTIKNLKIHNQEAYLITPSKDQIKKMDNLSAIIVKYPKPITINDIDYNYLIIWADKNNIQTIANNLKFKKE